MIKNTLIVVLGLVIQHFALAQTSTDSCVHLAHNYYIQQDYIRASKYLELIVEKFPRNRLAKKRLAHCYHMLGDELRLNHLLSLDGSTCFNLKKVHCKNDFASKLKKEKHFSYPKTELHAELGYRPRYTRADTLRGALRPERTCYDVYFYDLDIKLDPIRKSIDGTNSVYFIAQHAQHKLQIDLFENMYISSISMSEKELNYYREFNAVFVELPEGLVPGNKYILKIVYGGKPVKAENPPWLGGFVWTRDRKLSRWAGVACEQKGASLWWPLKDHLSDRPDSMAIHITVPKAFQAVSNGSFRGVDTLEAGENRFNWFVSYPINSYNVTFYMGKYTNFHDNIIVQDDTLSAWYHVLQGNEEIAREHFTQVHDIVPFYSSAFGPFPFPEDKFRMVESPYEGMEHQTAIAFGHKYSNQLNSIGYLNRDYDYIIVHEAAHEWWGNSLSIADMADLWLHEGFATYAEFLFIEEKLGYEHAIREIAYQSRRIVNIWPLVQNRDVNENTFAGQDVYMKGAMLLHCLRNTINSDTLYRNMLRDFHLSYRDSTIESSHFIDFINKYTNADYTALYKHFLFQTEPPLLSYSYVKNNKNLVLKYAWKNVDDGFEMPFSIEVIGSGKVYRIEASNTVQEIILENAESFRFYNGRADLSNCPHNGFSYYNTTYATEM